ncbi:pantoate--beta-alanine ligase [Paracoccus sp. Z330]|uniref:Pantothenate synthetase n=1 Tax=Paracoccus onchidii TaxID=3017813 RepID=A0ABT4Z9S8_9RHOB|nr:pantoate--beta-alanine ligase [Paracoccus onchidii]MDB6176107.1 pantoate--beta-alanine ligase [Paracoccus onchidii]
MQICRNKRAIRDCVSQWRDQDQHVALVPTMGALHDGHLQLVSRSREWLDQRGGGKIVTSIFVNPTQFDQASDLASYPRTEENDLRLLRQAGCDAAFLPAVDDIYRPGAQTVVEVTGLSRMLIGRLRPGHFRGMSTIVTKLFNIVRPDMAAFGEKDYQQLAIIRQMVADLDVPIDILGVPTVREADGLAMSSRNSRLSPEDRQAATALCAALDRGEELVMQGCSLAALRAELRRVLRNQPRASIRSIDIRDATTLARLTRIDRPVVMLLAVAFGDVLLIDQRTARP